MRAADVDILLVPGWTGAGPDHWMTRWQTKLKTSQRVVQDDWDVVVKAKWTVRLIERIAAASKPVVLVAHSCGVPTVVHAAARMPGTVAAAFLVAAPSEAACAAIPLMDPAFAVYPRDATAVSIIAGCEPQRRALQLRRGRRVGLSLGRDAGRCRRKRSSQYGERAWAVAGRRAPPCVVSAEARCGRMTPQSLMSKNGFSTRKCSAAAAKSDSAR